MSRYQACSISLPFFPSFSLPLLTPSFFPYPLSLLLVSLLLLLHLD